MTGKVRLGREDPALPLAEALQHQVEGLVKLFCEFVAKLGKFHSLLEDF